MGQYYKAIILGEEQVNTEEIIRFFLEAFFGSGSKLTEHSYIDNPFVNTFEFLLTKEGMFYKSRVVWAGDYADNEKNMDKNLYHIVNDLTDKTFSLKVKETKEYQYIINHTKKQYVDKKKEKIFHPLPLLTAEGNGRGGGDYRGEKENLIGIWARDVISVEKDKPEGYEELECKFSDDMDTGY